MRIIDTIVPNRPFFSLEFFPPKEKAEWPAFFQAVERLAGLGPLFASVTYGAGGSTRDDTLEIVTRLQRDHGLETMAHLTCIGAYRGALLKFLDALAAAGVTNILALRGDPPKEVPPLFSACGTLRYASDLVAFISKAHPGLGLAVAGYPEPHPEAESAESDLSHLKLKLDNGGDFAITQLFFDNRLYFDFVARARARGITKPIVPGILPVVSLKVIKRIVSLCGAYIPPAFLAELEEADARGGAAAVQQAGIAHARRQVRELLADGVPGVHLYTLNRAEAVLELTEGLL
ncbi:methylenetetrahydrofolate reductase [NAD(P)H] [Geobacter sp. SVR]|uniref:methylenetetrahydrofolate reductase [NAD(P)H] n=1 Tax=Geobacter sp. SVR TaxID=2495594 RepID=UPI00143EF5DD|nr:methylenetetrahydrofolate reductase [NAD(P)H] [Geobacter sp. SVR]BCS51745.1 methylenetetrahydrofolate reductase [Geobacter sp. SVR]GCF84932.1 methylenetetrahydrofolate reductase [Geobacter sp. SVR]